MQRLVSTALIAAACMMVAAAYPATAAAPQRIEFPESSEFPKLDSSAWNMMRRGMTEKALRAAAAGDARDPETLELLFSQGYGPEPLAYVDVIFPALFELAAGEPEQVEYAGAIVADHSELTRSQSDEHRALLEQLVAAIRARVPELPREQAARTVHRLLRVENELAGRNSRVQPTLRAFVGEYAGTEAALLAEVELIGFIRDTGEEIARLDAFIEQHPGTAAGAAALYAKAQAIRNDRSGRRAEPPQTDPTPRFRQLLAVVEELESGRWPAGEHVDRAPALVAGFFVSDRDEFAPGNLEWFSDAYLDFTVEHARALQESELGGDLGSAIYRIGTLGERTDDRFGAIERAFDRLEASDADLERLTWRRADFYVGESRDESGAEAIRAEARTKAFATLERLARSPDQTSARRARATIAELHFSEADYSAAIDEYRAYLTTWSDSTWSWVAALRLGQAQEALGDWEGASESYLDAARRYASPAPAAVLASVFAARASESLGHFDQALDHYLNAASAWDDDFGERYTLRPSAFTTRAEIGERIAELAASSQRPEGALLESGRRLLEEERWQEAHGLLTDMIRAHPASPLLAEARYLAHRAALEHAFEVADVEAERPDEAAAAELFQELSEQPWDPAVGAAALAVGAIVGKAGYQDRAWSLTRDALAAWRENQASFFASDVPPGRRDPALAADVTAIRDLLFQPMGAETYDHERGLWNAFDWPQARPDYFILNPDMRVQLADGRTVQVLVTTTPPDFDNTLLMTREHTDFLNSILTRLGGTETRPPRYIMETPNQPIGDSVEILALWKEFFPARPGHWGGWVLNSYPILGKVEFHDEARTSASVPVTIGYSGCTVHVEKRDGAWTVTRLSHFWIT